MGLFRMPALGADMEEGTLLEWLVKPGDEVAKGQVVAVIDTAKSAIDAEVFESGVVAELLVEPGTSVAVGTPLARIKGVDEQTPPEPPPEPVHEPTPAPPAPPPPLRHLMHEYGLSTGEVHGTGPEGRITRADVLDARRPPARARVTPRARRLAHERGVSLDTVESAGVVTGADIPAVAATHADRSATMREATAALMGRAGQEIPHYYVVDEVDMSAALEWLSQYNAERTPRERLLPVAMFLRATVLAAQAVPDLNGSWSDGFQPAEGVDLGVAVATRAGGLVTPRIVGAQALTIGELMAQLTDIVRRARSGRLLGSQVQPGSITVSSLADGGPGALFGVIYPPQVALVGVGSIAERPRVVEGKVVVRPTSTLTVAADHRASDGRTGARFLAAMIDVLEAPERMEGDVS